MAELCQTPDCGKPASMSCPTCLKLGLPRAMYCTQVRAAHLFENAMSVHAPPGSYARVSGSMSGAGQLSSKPQSRVANPITQAMHL
jgi:zf-MYND-like zinc finger, mRNA-binding